MNLQIGYLADNPDAVPLLAQWLFDEWDRHMPGSTAQDAVNKFQARMNRERLPLALVAYEGGSPVGTVSLKLREVESRPQLEHWLGALYVPEMHRGRGVGSQLVDRATKEARRLGVEALYLYTRHASTAKLYARLGWIEVERLVYRGRPARIMKRELGP